MVGWRQEASKKTCGIHRVQEMMGEGGYGLYGQAYATGWAAMTQSAAVDAGGRWYTWALVMAVGMAGIMRFHKR